MIDAHLHLQDPVFQGRREEIVEELREIGVKRLAVNGTGPDDWGEVAGLAERFEEVIPFFGVHPWKVNSLGEGWRVELRRLLDKFPEAGIGEVGLDRWVRNHCIATQKDVLRIHLELSRELRRPLAIHCLRAWGHLQEELDELPPVVPFLLHSFGGPSEMVDPMVERGAFFSISGYFFQEEKAGKLAVFRQVPRRRLLLETDAPDMPLPDHLQEYHLAQSGEKNRGGHPANIRVIYREVARWVDEDPDQFTWDIVDNFDLFLAKN